MKMGLAGKIARVFIDSPLTPLIITAALALGSFSILRTPREEEPQIVVPMLDVFVGMPGASAQEVEQRVTIPMERLLREVPGVEYLYSTSQPGGALVIVRFYVGIKEEDAIVRTYNKLYANFDRIPQGSVQPLIKARSIDDVPVLAVTFWGQNYDAFALRRIAAEVQQSVKQVENVSETTLLGGQRRELKITLDPQKLAAYHSSPLEIARVLQMNNQRSQLAPLLKAIRNSQWRPARSFGAPTTSGRWWSPSRAAVPFIWVKLQALLTGRRIRRITSFSARAQPSRVPPRPIRP